MKNNKNSTTYSHIEHMSSEFLIVYKFGFFTVTAAKSLIFVRNRVSILFDVVFKYPQ